MVEDRRSTIRPLVPEPLTAEAFAPFGAVIAHGRSDERWEFPAVFSAVPDARPRLWVNRTPKAPDAILSVALLERHPFSAQTFLPLRGAGWLVVVAPSGPDGLPDVQGLRAFASDGHHGLTYHVGTWHHGLLALHAPAEVAVIMGLTGRDDDTEFHEPSQTALVRTTDAAVWP